ncbi:YbaK/EbsC family protein [Renibacterium salmoninarum]|uniref:YbaK/EbsC family protein n=1 Tax=Renibacterium salmoninarum TaxID=1646 RepID=UPI0026A20D57|nr:YbaK/EbsC family protein [Renibacterium salmoninarum]
MRKASFLSRERATELTEMEFGGITPLGLPGQWPILVDAEVLELPLALIGSGIRKSKRILPGKVLAQVAGVEIVPGLGLLAAG